MKLELLYDHQYLIPEIAEWKLQAYGHLVPEKTLQDYTKSLEAQLNKEKLPIAYVLIENKQFIGTISLRKCDMDTHQHLSPWIGGVIVHPSKRNKGVGTILVKSVEEVAKELGYDRLYLYTSEKSDWYAKLGWQTLQHTYYHDMPVTVMEKSLIAVQ